jgi:hypothetical protein
VQAGDQPVTGRLEIAPPALAEPGELGDSGGAVLRACAEPHGLGDQVVGTGPHRHFQRGRWPAKGHPVIA